LHSLKEQIIKLKNDVLGAREFESAAVDNIQILILMMLLRSLRQILTLKFTINDGSSQTSDQVDSSFIAICELIARNKDVLRFIYSTDEAILEVSDLQEEVKELYKDLFETLNDRMTKNKTSLNREDGAHLENTLLKYLLLYGEETICGEYLEDDSKLRLDRYRACAQVYGYFIFSKGFNFEGFSLSQISPTYCGNKEDEFFKASTELLSKGCIVGSFQEIVNNKESKMNIIRIKEEIKIEMADKEVDSKLDQGLRTFLTLVKDRAKDLEGKINS